MSSGDRQNQDTTVARPACVHLLLGCDPRTLDDCLAASSNKDTMVLMDAAVTWLTRAELMRTIGKEVTIYCLEADVAAHGLATLPGSLDVLQISDRRLVELICQHQHCLSWK